MSHEGQKAEGGLSSPQGSSLRSQGIYLHPHPPRQRQQSVCNRPTLRQHCWTVIQKRTEFPQSSGAEEETVMQRRKKIPFCPLRVPDLVWKPIWPRKSEKSMQRELNFYMGMKVITEEGKQRKWPDPKSHFVQEIVNLWRMEKTQGVLGQGWFMEKK